MALDLADYEQKAKEAVKVFWQSRERAYLKQVQLGKVDAGQRGGVTAGKNMDGFRSLIVDIVKANGLGNADIHQERRVVCLPGYFRPTKLWDVLVINQGRLVAALELKSQVGPSFGNNFNNRTEEAIGTAHDFWTAFREGAFGVSPKPFVGWLILVEDAPNSRNKVRDVSAHFSVLSEFQNASYLQRYNVLCQKLIKEQLYTAASILSSPRTAISDGVYSELHAVTGLKVFVTSLAAHIAAEAARQG